MCNIRSVRVDRVTVSSGFTVYVCSKKLEVNKNINFFLISKFDNPQDHAQSFEAIFL